MEDRYLYEIHPVRPIQTKDGKLVKKACSILLTKEEVKTYLKKCPVYRKVSGATNKMIRVTLSNLDEVHTPSGYGEVKPVSVTPNTTNVNIIDESKPEHVVETPVPIVEEAIVEETPVVEDTKEEEPVVQDEVADSDTIDSVEELISTGTVQPNNSGKKKHKHH